MSTTTLVVVGDRFSEFLGNRGTISASSLLQRLRSADTGSTAGITPTQILVGQASPPTSAATSPRCWAERRTSTARPPSPPTRYGD